ncbi:MAG: hypothetical protein ACIAQF_03680 [Phycisphaerales bacterium JB065]
MKKLHPARVAALAICSLLATQTATATEPSISEQISAIFATQEDGATLRELTEQLDKLPPTPETAYARATTRFLIAFEGLLQGAHRHGFLQTFNEVGPMMSRRMQIISWTANDNPAETTPQLINIALKSFIIQLADAERVLAEIDGDFKLEIEIPAIRFDIDADGKASSAESLRSLFALMPQIGRWDPGQRRTVWQPLVPEDLVVAFDRGDAEWMRGYCHALSGFSELILAHDYTDWFDRTGFVLFPKAVTTHDSLPGTTWFIESMFGAREPAPFDLTDILAMIGNFQMPVTEPERMTRALEHFRKTVDHARAMWEHYDAETDDDCEWIPNPNQTAAFHEVEVSLGMRDAWLALIDEADAVLNGKKLLRFWRGDGSKGIDLVAVFTEPRDFNLLYWIQGSAATPYLREGEFTAPGTWAQIRRLTERRYFRFSFWFN